MSITHLVKTGNRTVKCKQNLYKSTYEKNAFIKNRNYSIVEENTCHKMVKMEIEIIIVLNEIRRFMIAVTTAFVVDLLSALKPQTKYVLFSIFSHVNAIIFIG